MTVKEMLIKDSENYQLPIILVSPSGMINRYKSVNKFLSINNELCNMKYVNACVQLDLNGEDSFVVVFYSFYENLDFDEV